jgi:hypothetical protein
MISTAIVIVSLLIAAPVLGRGWLLVGLLLVFFHVVQAVPHVTVTLGTAILFAVKVLSAARAKLIAVFSFFLAKACDGVLTHCFSPGCCRPCRLLLLGMVLL